MKSPVDVWEKLGDLFVQETDEDPEIIITGLTEDEMCSCLWHLLEQGSHLTVVFRLTADNEAIAFSAVAPEAVLALLSEPPFQVAAMFTASLPALPTMAFYIDEPGCISIGYSPGYEWNAMTVLALFDLLHWIHETAPEAAIMPDPESFTPDEQELFEETLQDFLDEKI